MNTKPICHKCVFNCRRTVKLYDSHSTVSPSVVPASTPVSWQQLTPTTSTAKSLNCFHCHQVARSFESNKDMKTDWQTWDPDVSSLWSVTQSGTWLKGFLFRGGITFSDSRSSVLPPSSLTVGSDPVPTPGGDDWLFPGSLCRVWLMKWFTDGYIKRAVLKQEQLNKALKVTDNAVVCHLQPPGQHVTAALVLTCESCPIVFKRDEW